MRQTPPFKSFLVQFIWIANISLVAVFARSQPPSKPPAAAPQPLVKEMFLSDEPPVSGLNEFLIEGPVYAALKGVEKDSKYSSFDGLGHRLEPEEMMTIANEFADSLFRSQDKFYYDTYRGYGRNCGRRSCYLETRYWLYDDPAKPRDLKFRYGNFSGEDFIGDSYKSPDYQVKLKEPVSEVLKNVERSFDAKLAEYQQTSPRWHSYRAQLQKIVNSLLNPPKNFRVRTEHPNENTAIQRTNAMFQQKFGSSLEDLVSIHPDSKMNYQTQWRELYRRELNTDVPTTKTLQLPKDLEDKLLEKSIFAQLKVLERKLAQDMLADRWDGTPVSVWKTVEIPLEPGEERSWRKYKLVKEFQGAIRDVLEKFPSARYNSYNDSLQISQNRQVLFDREKKYANETVLPDSERYPFEKYQELTNKLGSQRNYDRVGMLDALTDHQSLAILNYKSLVDNLSKIESYLWSASVRSKAENVGALKRAAENLKPEAFQNSLKDRWFRSSFRLADAGLSTSSLQVHGIGLLRLYAATTDPMGDLVRRQDARAKMLGKTDINNVWEDPHEYMRLTIYKKTFPSSNAENLRGSKFRGLGFPLGGAGLGRSKIQDLDDIDSFLEGINDPSDIRQSQNFPEGRTGQGAESAKGPEIFRLRSKTAGRELILMPEVRHFQFDDEFISVPPKKEGKVLSLESLVPQRLQDGNLLMGTLLGRNLSALKLIDDKGTAIDSNAYEIRRTKDGSYYVRIRNPDLADKRFRYTATFDGITAKSSLEDLSVNVDRLKNWIPQIEEAGLGKLARQLEKINSPEIRMSELLQISKKATTYEFNNPKSAASDIPESNPFKDLSLYANDTGCLAGVCREHNDLFSTLVKVAQSPDSPLESGTRTVIPVSKNNPYRTMDSLHAITEIKVGDAHYFADATNSDTDYLNSLSKKMGKASLWLGRLKGLFSGRPSLDFAMGDDGNLGSEGSEKAVKSDEPTIEKEKKRKKDKVKEIAVVQEAQKGISAGSKTEVIENSKPKRPPIDINDPEFKNFVDRLEGLVKKTDELVKSDRKTIKRLAARGHPASRLAYLSSTLQMGLFTENHQEFAQVRIRELAGTSLNNLDRSKPFRDQVLSSINALEDKLNYFNSEAILNASKNKGVITEADALTLKSTELIKPLQDLMKEPILDRAAEIPEALERYQKSRAALKQKMDFLPEFKKRELRRDREKALKAEIDESIRLLREQDLSRFQRPKDTCLQTLSNLGVQ